ncbi:MAG TPA: glucose-1-phosphate adenylyltransferase [Aggregatilineales bacterium]|nr:glucose-1-phosphate adenylyltransferase [Aggregatilineales bacterium]
MRTRAVILAGGEGTRLSVLTAKRAKPAVPFAGKYRIIDFTLSNCVNSDIFDVVILTQYRPHSLNEHIGRGQPWDLDRSFSGGIQLLQPYKGRKPTDWYLGTADAVWQNLNFIRRGGPEFTLILSGDHIYEMDYAALVQYHQEKNADMTICTLRVPMDEANRYGILDVNAQMRVANFVEKPANPPSDLASMGVYVFKTSMLERVLAEDAEVTDSNHDFGKDIIPQMIRDKRKVFAYPFDSYWIDVGTIDAYWEAHMDLLGKPPSLNLNDRSWIIHTRSEERPPVILEAGSTVRNSMITDGCVISEGALVERSVLSPGVHVGPNAVIRDSIILTDTYIEANAVLERCIIDKYVVIGQGVNIGKITDIGELGISVVGKNTRIPSGFIIGRNVTISTDLGEPDFMDYIDKTIGGSGKKVTVERRKVAKAD